MRTPAEFGAFAHQLHEVVLVQDSDIVGFLAGSLGMKLAGVRVRGVRDLSALAK